MELLTDDVKEKLIKLIEDDLQFVDKPKDLLCSNCGVIPLFHNIYPCSHPYCRDCYVNVCVRLKKKCRVCKTSIGPEMLQSKEIEAAIYKIKAICPNKPFGCNDEVELSDLLEHLVLCKFPKENQLPKLYNEARNTSDEGMADLNDLKLSIERIQTTVDELVKSIRNSTAREEQQKIENERLSEENKKLSATVQKLMASFETVDSKFAEIKEQTARNRSDSKEEASAIGKDVELVKQLLSDTVATIESSIEKKVSDDVARRETADSEQIKTEYGAMTKRMDTFASWVKATGTNWLNEVNFTELSQNEIKDVTENIRQWKNGTLLWQINNYADKRKENASVSSEPCYLDDCGYTFRLELEFGASDEPFSMKLITSSKDGIPNCRYHYRAMIYILDQSDRSSKSDWSTLLEPPFGSSVPEWINELNNCFISNFGNFEEKKIQPKYLKNDTMYVKVQVNPLPLLFGNYFSRDGKLVFTIDNYSRSKLESQLGINIFFRSESFCSSEHGYRLRAMVGWVDDAIMFMLFFLVGENDSKLPSTYNHKCTVFVVNQKDDSGNNDLSMKPYPKFRISGTVDMEEFTNDMAAIHRHCVCSLQSTYEKDPFLVNNKMIFKVVVEIL